MSAETESGAGHGVAQPRLNCWTYAGHQQEETDDGRRRRGDRLDLGRDDGEATEWKEATIAIMAISMPMSPTRFITNAFLAATAYAGT